MDSLLNASLELYKLKSTVEITDFTAKQLIWAFPKISLGMIFKTKFDDKHITIHHNMPDKEHSFFSESFDSLISDSTENTEKYFVAQLNKISNSSDKPINRKDRWKFFSMHSTEGLISGKLILRGINLKVQNENTLKLFMHQITSALENRLLVEQLAKKIKH
jgi:hypothetical protein